MLCGVDGRPKDEIPAKIGLTSLPFKGGAPEGARPNFTDAEETVNGEQAGPASVAAGMASGGSVAIVYGRQARASQVFVMHNFSLDVLTVAANQDANEAAADVGGPRGLGQARAPLHSHGTAIYPPNGTARASPVRGVQRPKQHEDGSAGRRRVLTIAILVSSLDGVGASSKAGEAFRGSVSQKVRAFSSCGVLARSVSCQARDFHVSPELIPALKPVALRELATFPEVLPMGAQMGGACKAGY